ncbi:MAG: retroviral-like aspartic protease family protein [Spirochaetaceae bacterium]|nr:retroviral-like aspartic protease family protein [Spirochaetaceae bacterium]
MIKQFYLVFGLMVFIFFSCSSEKPETFDRTVLSVNGFQPFVYQLFQPDLDSSKYAQTHKLINIEINDKFYPFIVDTGDSNGTLKISQQVSNDIAAIETGKKSKSKTFYGKTKESEVLIPKLRIGNLDIQNLPCKVVEDSYFWPWNIRKNDIGKIGWRLLNKLNLLFDYQVSELVFYDTNFIPDNILGWN